MFGKPWAKTGFTSRRELLPSTLEISRRGTVWGNRDNQSDHQFVNIKQCGPSSWLLSACSCHTRSQSGKISKKSAIRLHQKSSECIARRWSFCVTALCSAFEPLWPLRPAVRHAETDTVWHWLYIWSFHTGPYIEDQGLSRNHGGVYGPCWDRDASLLSTVHHTSSIIFCVLVITGNLPGVSPLQYNAFFS